MPRGTLLLHRRVLLAVAGVVILLQSPPAAGGGGSEADSYPGGWNKAKLSHLYNSYNRPALPT